MIIRTFAASVVKVGQCWSACLLSRAFAARRRCTYRVKLYGLLSRVFAARPCYLYTCFNLKTFKPRIRGEGKHAVVLWVSTSFKPRIRGEGCSTFIQLRSDSFKPRVRGEGKAL